MKKYRVVIVIFAASLAVPFSAFAHGQKDSFRNDNTTTEMGRNEHVPGKGPDDDVKIAVITGVLTVDGKSVTVRDKTLSSIRPGQNVVLVLNGGTAVLSGIVLSKTGDSADPDQSNFTGMNAAALATGGSQLTLENVQITSDADGANAVFSTGNKSVITVTGLKVYTKGNSSRGLDATYGGTIHAADIDITTEGAHCAAIATDRGEGTILVTGGKVSTAGDGSPTIYSTGAITAIGLTGSAKGAEIAAIEGKNSITLDGCDLTGAGTHGVMLYQSFSGDAGTGTSVFTAKNSKLTSVSNGPFFYITNTDAKADLSGCSLVYPSGTLVQVSGNDGLRGWGRPGSNGGTFLLTAHNQTLTGDIVCDSISSMDFVLAAGTVYTGTVNSADEGTVSLTLEKTSVWNVTGDSYVASLKDTDTSLLNIKSNGHTIRYDVNNDDNSIFGGKTIALADGGKLVPYSVVHTSVTGPQKGDRQGEPANGGGDMNGNFQNGTAPGMQMHGGRDMQGKPEGSGMRGGPDQMKSYTGMVSVKGKDAGVYLTIGGTVYKVVLPEPPDEKGRKPEGGMEGKTADNPPDDGGRGKGGNPPPAEIPTFKELRKLEGTKVLCKGLTQKANDGSDEFVLFECSKVPVEKK